MVYLEILKELLGVGFEIFMNATKELFLLVDKDNLIVWDSARSQFPASPRQQLGFQQRRHIKLLLQGNVPL
jgi:hypothetical protein